MKKYRANGLLEMLLVIAVCSVLVFIAVRYFTAADLNGRVAQAISKIDTITQASYQWRTTEKQASFAMISSQQLLDDDLLSASDLLNPWGGNTIVSAGSHGAHDHVNIKLISVPQYACESLRRHLGAVAFTQVSEKDCKLGDYSGDF